jgi:hypothetical protein
MTTYQHNLTLSDGEMIMIQSALLRMIVHCEVNLSDGIKAPYWANKIAATNVFNRLFDDSIQMSGNNFASTLEDFKEKKALEKGQLTKELELLKKRVAKLKDGTKTKLSVEKKIQFLEIRINAFSL